MKSVWNFEPNDICLPILLMIMFGSISSRESFLYVLVEHNEISETLPFVKDKEPGLVISFCSSCFPCQDVMAWKPCLSHGVRIDSFASGMVVVAISV